MLKKLMALVLVLLMVVPMIAACGDDKEEDQTEVRTQNAANDNDVATDDDPLMAEIDEHIEELSSSHNFDGKSFTWIGGGHMTPIEEEETGDVMNDAMYYRQRDIEELFGIDWNNKIAEGDEVSGHPTTQAVLQDVLAGTNAYDLAYGMASSVCQPLFIQNALSDVSGYSTLDLDREWWTQSLRDSFSINGALYFLNGSICTYHYLDCSCILFNKQVAEDYGIEDMYSLVKSGEWTFDKMIEIAETIPTNENGSGAYRYCNPNGIATIVGHGINLAKFDEDGLPYVEDNLSLELSDLADKFCKIYSDTTQTTPPEMVEGHDEWGEVFAEGSILFLFSRTDEAAWLRTQDIEFGILPIPKGSVTQENYICAADREFYVVVPKSTKDHSVTDVILEAMGALGYKYFKPVYYDNILKSRATYDNESKDMIDIVFATKKYDMISMLDVGGSDSNPGSYYALLEKSVEESSEGLASNYFMQSMIVNNNIKSILASVEADR